MNIVHVIETLDPAWGGPPFVSKRLVAAQALRGHSVTVISRNEPEQLRQQITGSLEAIPSTGELTLEWADRDGWRSSLQLPPDVEIVHLHGVWESILRDAAGQATSQGVPYVVMPHGMLDPWSLSQKRWKKRIALTLFVKRMLKGAGFLHALSESEQRLMAPLGLDTKCEVIPNGVFLEEIDPRPAPGSFYERHPRLEGRPFILFLSRLHYKKGLDLLASAFGQLARVNADAQLVIIGPDYGARDAFLRQIEEAGLLSRTHLLGPVYGREKIEAYVDSSCFCLPSRQEGFSVAILEALACGVPVVISTECHFPKVADAEAGRVVSLDPDEVANALTEMLGDDATRVRMGQNGRELVLREFTWPAIADRCLAAYKRARQV